MKLYRGVGDHIDQANGGLIKPKSQNEKAEAYAGSCDWRASSTRIPIGAASKETAQVLHNSCSTRNPTSYASFTDCREAALWFAWYECDYGWLYEIETDDLDAAGIEWANNTEGVRYRSEREFLVNLKGFDSLPNGLILDRMLVIKPKLK